MNVSKMQVGIVGLFALVASGAAALDYSSFKNSQETVTATVVDKERLCKTVAEYDDVTDENGNTHSVQTGSHEECTNYIHTKSETFINDGVVWAGKFDATALQGRLVRGETYQFRVYGSADERLGMFRKIITAGEILPGGGDFGGGGSKNW